MEVRCSPRASTNKLIREAARALGQRIDEARAKFEQTTVTAPGESGASVGDFLTLPPLPDRCQ
jgi:hypothetical protein